MALEFEIKSLAQTEAKQIIPHTNIVLLPSPKLTGTCFLLAAQGHPAVLRPGQQRDKAACCEAGHFAPSEMSKITGSAVKVHFVHVCLIYLMFFLFLSV